jgi:hypothetical protein
LANREAGISPALQAFQAGEEILRLMQPPLKDEALDRIDVLLAERERLLKLAMEATAADREKGPDPETLRRLGAQQRALEEQVRRLMAALLESSGESQEARNSMQAVHRILNPGVRPRWVDTRR